jgi:hypothetical protein
MKREEWKQFFRAGYKDMMLIEQDDPFATDDEGGEEEEPADEGGDEEAAEDEGGDEEAAEDEGGDDEGEDEAPKADEEDEVRFGKSLDDQLQAIFIDIESDAIKSAQVQEESFSLKRLLLVEQEDAPSIDVDKFAAETARIIKNFDAFFDIEDIVYSKARSFLLDKYGDEVADEVADLLDVRHDIKEKEETKAAQEEWEEQVPIAVGATGGAGA